MDTRNIRKRTRSAVSGILRRLPVSSKFLGPPKGWFASTDEWLHRGSAAAQASHRREIFPALKSARTTKPRSLDANVPWPFLAYYGGMLIEDPPGWIVEIPDGRVVDNGTVITPDDYMLADVSRQLLVGTQAGHSVNRRCHLGTLKKLPGRIAVLAVANTTYWHWFFDLLPRILLIREQYGTFEDIDGFIVNPLDKTYQHQTLEILGVPPSKIIERARNGGFHVQADHLIVPSVTVEVPSRWACLKLREVLTEVQPPPSGGKRIYISRADARLRNVENEQEVLSLLSEYGFESVQLTGLSISEQRDIFSSAEFVVAPHGAGLTNLVFSRQGTTVLELFSPVYVNPCYWALSDHLELNYYYLLGEGEMPPPPPPGIHHDEWFASFVRKDRSQQAIRVDISGLRKLLEEALDAGVE